MKLEATLSLILAVIFTLASPICFWSTDWAFTRVSVGSICWALMFWFSYFRLKEIDKKNRIAAHHEKNPHNARPESK
jgi:hypothetical protein